MGNCYPAIKFYEPGSGLRRTLLLNENSVKNFTTFFFVASLVPGIYSLLLQPVFVDF